MYNEFKRKLRTKVNEINEDKRKRDISTADTLYMTIALESMALTYTKVSYNLASKKEINFSPNTFCDRRMKLDESDFNEMIDVLFNFLKNDLKIESNIFAVDGTKLSLSLEMNEFGFPMVRQRSNKKIQIDTLKEIYKKLFGSIRNTAKDEIKKLLFNINILKKHRLESPTDFDAEIINCNDKITQIKQNKKNTIVKLMIERKNKIKNIKIKVNDNPTDYEICTDKKKARYCKGLLTTIFDVVNKLPIKMNLTTNLNERLHIMSMIDNTIKPGSIIIFDRGYYSEELLKFLNDRGIIPIFRLCSSYTEPKYLELYDKLDDIFQINEIDFKVIKYIINENNYYVGTTDINLNTDKLQQMYWFRWTIEEFYKKVKHTMKGEFFNVKHVKTLRQTISAMQFGSLYTSIITHIAVINKVDQRKKRQSTKILVKRETKINFKDALNISISEFLYDTLCSDQNTTFNDSRIIFLLNLIYNARYVNITNRSNERHSILFRGKWSF